MMVRNATPWILATSILAAAGGGCAGRAKQRIALLEEANASLTQRLNRTSTDLNAARREQEDLDRRLQEVLGEAETLRQRLAEKPAPQTTEPGWTNVPGGAMIAIEANVLFAPGRVALRKEARRALQDVVSALQGTYADKDVLVLGHTDDRPIKKSGWQDNSQLSTERALAVVRYLRARGVAPERLIAGGCGEYRPRVANASDADRATNRRVEIFALEPLPRSGAP